MGGDVWIPRLSLAAPEGAEQKYFDNVSPAPRYLHSPDGRALTKLAHTQVMRAAKTDGMPDASALLCVHLSCIWIGRVLPRFGISQVSFPCASSSCLSMEAQSSQVIIHPPPLGRCFVLLPKHSAFPSVRTSKGLLFSPSPHTRAPHASQKEELFYVSVVVDGVTATKFVSYHPLPSGTALGSATALKQAMAHGNGILKFGSVSSFSTWGMGQVWLKGNLVGLCASLVTCRRRSRGMMWCHITHPATLEIWPLRLPPNRCFLICWLTRCGLLCYFAIMLPLGSRHCTQWLSPSMQHA